MNPAQDTPLSDIATAPSRRNLTAHFHINLALIVAVLALILLAVFWLNERRSMDKLELEVSKRLASGQTMADEIRRSAEHNTERLQDTGNRLAILENKLSEAQSQQEALNSMYQALAQNREDWLVAETEQTLMLAHQQLQLAGNIPAALAALQSLDQRLGEINGPKIIRLHAALAQDIASLKALPYVDNAQLAGRLDTLLQKIDALPLQVDHVGKHTADEVSASPEQLSFAQRVGQSAWRALSQLIVVRRIDGQDPAVMGPEHSFYVRENFKLRLGAARLTLLQKNTPLFQSDIAAAQAILDRYFDRKDRDVIAAQQELTSLRSVRLQSEIVDLSSTIALARDLLRSTEAVPAKPSPVNAGGKS